MNNGRKIPGSGRKKGSKNKPPKYNLIKALKANGLDPLTQLMEDLPNVTAEERVKVWTRILLAIHGRPRNGVEKSENNDAIDVTPEKNEFLGLSPEEIKAKLNDSGSK